jgi:hypothetical protein
MLVPDLLGAGQQAGKLQLRTSDAQQPTAIVPLRVDATSGARLVPPHLFLVGPDRTGRAELLAADGQPLEVVTARTTGPLRLSWSGNVVSVTGESLVTGCHVFVEGADGRMRHLAVSVLP